MLMMKVQSMPSISSCTNSELAIIYLDGFSGRTIAMVIFDNIFVSLLKSCSVVMFFDASFWLLTT